ncbi:MAG: EamA family transporter [Candidatus Gracilibacteria bacterium]|nr:EamA family transporter [Candidatus Gracilibacteria bacterium]
MEIWLIFAIITVFTSGLHNFTLKVAAEKNYNVSVINIYSYLIGAIFLGFYLLFAGVEIDYSVLHIIALLALGNGLFFLLSVFSRIESMKNIDTIIFFPLYKTFGPILVTLVSLFFFKETLELKEIIGIIIGISVPLLLITSSENKRQKNLYLGVLFMLLTAFLTTITSGISKEVVLQDYNIITYLFLTSLFGLLFSVFSYFYSDKKKRKYHQGGIFKFSLISGILHLVTFFTFMGALEGNLAVVFTIVSFSILIPIILSIIFYNDHFNKKKYITFEKNMTYY